MGGSGPVLVKRGIAARLRFDEARASADCKLSRWTAAKTGTG